VFGLVPAEYRRAPRSCQHLTAEELNPAQEPETDQTDVEQVTPPISRSMVFFATSNIAAEHANVHCRYRKLAINFNTSMNRDPDSRVENP
jgi:hypothetical protein